ncbi:MAG: dihydroorotate dehydrogenase electron transfer subunit [Ruminococcaceae bacterium]|nr:dihydroorotate dehydrogenase electron transfer subunit [Oscillospiraceae bacterium]
MKEVIFTIVENIPLTSTVFKMVLEGNTSQITAPGQFVEIAVPGRFLRRPISVCDWSENSLTLIYKVVGSGTADLSTMTPGTTLNILTGLGNGYDLSVSGDAPLLLGGGVGVPPMYGLCKALLAEGKTPTVILGFNTAAEVFYEDAFRALGVEVLVTTVDGSRGIQGFVTDAMTVPYTYFYTCGPGPMLRAIDRVAKTSGQFSLEERMGCGFGACMGCTIETKVGPRRVCKDGPVFCREEVIL